MNEQEVLVSDLYIRGSWMLERQVVSVEDLIVFWKMFPAIVKVPDIELRSNWDVI